MEQTENKNILHRLAGSIAAYVRTKAALRLLICVCFVVIMTLMFLVAIVPTRYDLRVGQVPTVTITATKDVVDEITTEKKRSEAAQNVTPSYKYQEGISEQVLAQFDTIYAQLNAVCQYAATLDGHDTRRTYTREELDYASSILTLVTLRDYQMTTLLNTSQEDLTTLYDSLYAALKNTMAGNVTQGQESDAIQSITLIVGYRTDTSLLQNVVIPVLKVCVQPNMIIDQEATEAARQAARDAVEAVVYKQGQNIVVKGEGRITQNQLKMLETLGLLSNGSFDLNVYLGSVMIVVITLVLLLIALKLIVPEVISSTRKLLLVFSVMILTFLLCILIRMLNVYLIPVIMAAVLLSAMISLKAGILCNISLAILSAALAAGGNEVYTAQMVNIITASILSGSLAALLVNNTSGRVRAVLSGVSAAVLNFIVVFAYGLMTSSSGTSSVNDALYCGCGGLIAGILSVVLQPILESLFNVATASRLLDLSNPNSPLLRRMMLEAPGTYHHCILVANLAEACANAVGANPMLARVGAYYHDIGKLKRPLYFKENQMGEENIHDHTDTMDSVSILTSHTEDGVSIAKANHLPREIQKIIAEHHGNTAVMYFYRKAQSESFGQEVDIDRFRYQGDTPTTKESGIIMLCDTIEAAIRSRSQVGSAEEIEESIRKLIQEKMADGQMKNCPLTFSDVEKITQACVKVLQGVYHDRIEYPEEKPKRHPFRMPQTLAAHSDEPKENQSMSAIENLNRIFEQQGESISDLAKKDSPPKPADIPAADSGQTPEAEDAEKPEENEV